MNVSAFDSLQQHPANSGFNAGQNTCIPTHLHAAMHSSDADASKLDSPASRLGEFLTVEIGPGPVAHGIPFHVIELHVE